MASWRFQTESNLVAATGPVAYCQARGESRGWRLIRRRRAIGAVTADGSRAAAHSFERDWLITGMLNRKLADLAVVTVLMLDQIAPRIF